MCVMWGCVWRAPMCVCDGLCVWCLSGLFFCGVFAIVCLFCVCGLVCVCVCGVCALCLRVVCVGVCCV